MALGGSNSDAVAQDQIKAFVERIMRMREEAKAINDDIREIYAEAKANGFDKTVLGKIVIHVERRSKDNVKMLEAQALFDLYLDAFDGATGTVVATHTHETALSSEAFVRKMRDEEWPDRQAEPAIAADQGGEGEPGHGTILPAEPIDREEEGSLDTGHLSSGQRPEGDPVNPEAGAVIDVGAGESPATLHPAALNALKLRPYCLHADDLTQCAGVGKKHCAMCLAAHADAEGMSA